MIRVLFVCHGNICRSAAAEMILRQMAEKEHVDILVDSAATTAEEIGNDLYPPMKKAMQRRNMRCDPHRAKKTKSEDYNSFDRIVAMDFENLDDLMALYGGDPCGKISLLMNWTGQKDREVSDPWYTRRFDACLDDLEAGCESLLQDIKKEVSGL